jgi:hypothetical protein
MTVQMVKIYFDPTLPIPQKRTYYADLTRLFWHSDGRVEQERQFGETILKRVETLEDADVTALPMSWNYYLETKQLSPAQAFIALSRAAYKPCVIFAMGDYKPHTPSAGVITFASSLYRSRLQPRTYAVPAIFEDYIQVYYGGEAPLREKSPVPVAGFCGQGKASEITFLKLLARNLRANIINTLGIARYEAPPIVPHTRLRSKVLTTIQSDSRLDTDFIIHDRYWAGLTNNQSTSEQRKAAKRRFVENIVNTDYTVCVRGAANYSKRFYEALCCGRIPIFVNTDCVLPFENAIDWKQYCVWVEADELNQIGDKVLAFHNALSNRAFKELQTACRQLWLDRLTQGGFMGRFQETI